MTIPGARESIELPVERASTEDLPFYCVSTAKFSILSVVTFGVYDIYWFYRNWKQIRDRTGRDIWPFWRGVFSFVFCYGVASAVDSAAQPVHVERRTRPGPTAVAYAVMLALAELPDPWWLVSLFSFVPLLPMVRQIREIHEALRPGLDAASGWSLRSATAGVVGASLLALALVGTLGPPPHVLRGGDVPGRYRATLLDEGILEPGETIDYFYSAGFASILEDGNLLTDRRVISYERAAGEMHVAWAAYAEVRDVVPDFSESFVDETTVAVRTIHGDTFLLVVSPEDGLDHAFVEELLARVPGDVRRSTE